MVRWCLIAGLLMAVPTFGQISPPSGGGGSGTVTSGASGQLAGYSAAGTTVGPVGALSNPSTTGGIQTFAGSFIAGLPPVATSGNDLAWPVASLNTCYTISYLAAFPTDIAQRINACNNQAGMRANMTISGSGPYTLTWVNGNLPTGFQVGDPFTAGGIAATVSAVTATTITTTANLSSLSGTVAVATANTLGVSQISLFGESLTPQLYSQAEVGNTTSYSPELIAPKGMTITVNAFTGAVNAVTSNALMLFPNATVRATGNVIGRGLVFSVGSQTVASTIYSVISTQDVGANYYYHVKDTVAYNPGGITVSNYNYELLNGDDMTVEDNNQAMYYGEQTGTFTVSGTAITMTSGTSTVIPAVGTIVSLSATVGGVTNQHPYIVGSTTPTTSTFSVTSTTSLDGATLAAGTYIIAQHGFHHNSGCCNHIIRAEYGDGDNLGGVADMIDGSTGGPYLISGQTANHGALGFPVTYAGYGNNGTTGSPNSVVYAGTKYDELAGLTYGTPGDTAPANIVDGATVTVAEDSLAGTSSAAGTGLVSPAWLLTTKVNGTLSVGSIMAFHNFALPVACLVQDLNLPTNLQCTASNASGQLIGYNSGGAPLTATDFHAKRTVQADQAFAGSEYASITAASSISPTYSTTEITGATTVNTLSLANLPASCSAVSGTAIVSSTGAVTALTSSGGVGLAAIASGWDVQFNGGATQYLTNSPGATISSTVTISSTAMTRTAGSLFFPAGALMMVPGQVVQVTQASVPYQVTIASVTDTSDAVLASNAGGLSGTFTLIGSGFTLASGPGALSSATFVAAPALRQNCRIETVVDPGVNFGSTGNIATPFVNNTSSAYPVEWEYRPLEVANNVTGLWHAKIAPPTNLQSLAQYGNITMTALSTPAAATYTTALTGGTLTDSTAYYYRVAALNAIGTTLASTESTVTTGASGANSNSITVKWVPVAGATSYKVYGRTTGAELLIATVTGNLINNYTDTGSVTPSGALPTANTSLGTVTTPGIIPGVLYSAAGTALPTCAAGIKGEQATVSDATMLGSYIAYASGGVNTAGVLCSYNGTTYSWLVH